MKKNLDKILAEFDDAIMAEEMAIPIYSSHILATLDRAGLSKDQIKKINQQMSTLSRESLKHIKMLRSAKKFLKENKYV